MPIKLTFKLFKFLVSNVKLSVLPLFCIFFGFAVLVSCQTREVRLDPSGVIDQTREVRVDASNVVGIIRSLQGVNGGPFSKKRV